MYPEPPPYLAPLKELLLDLLDAAVAVIAFVFDLLGIELHD